MALNTVPTDAPDAPTGGGPAAPFPPDQFSVNDNLPAYMSWGEWNITRETNVAVTPGRESSPSEQIGGFWVLGKQTPVDQVARLLGAGSSEITGYYHGPAVCTRTDHNGVGTPYNGVANIEVRFADQQFGGVIELAPNTRDTPLTLQMNGIVDPYGLNGQITAISDPDFSDSSIADSSVQGNFYGPQEPDAIGGVFRADTMNEIHYQGAFAGPASDPAND